MLLAIGQIHHKNRGVKQGWHESSFLCAQHRFTTRHYILYEQSGGGVLPSNELPNETQNAWTRQF